MSLIDEWRKLKKDNPSYPTERNTSQEEVAIWGTREQAKEKYEKEDKESREKKWNEFKRQAVSGGKEGLTHVADRTGMNINRGATGVARRVVKFRPVLGRMPTGYNDLHESGLRQKKRLFG